MEGETEIKMKQNVQLASVFKLFYITFPKDAFLLGKNVHNIYTNKQLSH